MPIELRMPSSSAGMPHGSLTRWHMKNGDVVTKGEVIALIETDKAIVDFEAPESGRLWGIDEAAGPSYVAPNALLGFLLRDGEGDPPASLPSPPRPELPKPVPFPQSGATRNRDRSRASPRARRLAAHHGIDLSAITGSGPQGRIVQLDVENARLRAKASLEPPSAPVVLPTDDPTPFAGSSAAGANRLRHSATHKTTAQLLVDAKQTAPHFYLTVDCDIDELLALKDHINRSRESTQRISLNDFVVKAAAAGLSRVPAVNVSWTGHAMVMHGNIDIAVAVATDRGLLTPIVTRANRKSLGVVSSEIRGLAERARAGKLGPEEYQGGSFYISNLGMCGIKEFAATVNPPHSAMLAVGAARRQPVCRGDQIAPGNVLTCTLSVDQRAVDGAHGAEFLGEFRQLLEHPMSILV